MSYTTLRTFTTRNFRVALAWTYEPQPDSSWWDEETRAKMESGEWASFLFRVTVTDAHGCEIGSDFLGDSVHADPVEFMDHRLCGRANRENAAKGVEGRCGSYFADMVARSIEEARQTYSAPRARLRVA